MIRSAYTSGPNRYQNNWPNFLTSFRANHRFHYSTQRTIFCDKLSENQTKLLQSLNANARLNFGLENAVRRTALDQPFELGYQF